MTWADCRHILASGSKDGLGSLPLYCSLLKIVFGSLPLLGDFGKVLRQRHLTCDNLRILLESTYLNPSFPSFLHLIQEKKFV